MLVHTIAQHAVTAILKHSAADWERLRRVTGRPHMLVVVSFCFAALLYKWNYELVSSAIDSIESFLSIGGSRSDSIEIDRIKLSNSTRSNCFTLQPSRSNRLHRSVEFDPIRSNSIAIESIESVLSTGRSRSNSSDSIEFDRVCVSSSIRSNWFPGQSIRSERFYGLVESDRFRSNSVECD